jgi:hypothetical protein
LSSITTSSPRLTSSSAIWEPINPAPPVTTYRILTKPHVTGTNRVDIVEYNSIIYCIQGIKALVIRNKYSFSVQDRRLQYRELAGGIFSHDRESSMKTIGLTTAGRKRERRVFEDLHRKSSLPRGSDEPLGFRRSASLSDSTIWNNYSVETHMNRLGSHPKREK